MQTRAFDCEQLSLKIKGYMSDRRYLHTLGVARAASFLAKIYLPKQEDELICAALLHDIAKDLKADELLDILGDNYPGLSKEDYDTHSALHSFAAPVIISRDFPEYATKDVLSSVFNHTLGDPALSLFDKIVYIADYIEDGRVNPGCVEVRNYLLQALKDDPDRALYHLNKAIIMSVDNTSAFLYSKGIETNSRSTKMRESLLEQI